MSALSKIDEGAIQLAFREYRKGRYRVDRLIGEGAMGGVFLAYDNKLHRLCAIKVLRVELLDNGNIKDRFMREAVIMTQIDHPAVVRVYDLDEIDEIPFIVLEWIDGGSLWDHIDARGPMAPEMAVYVMTLVCAGIEAAHAKGVIHRDIKPDNVLLATNGYPKVTDFGIALMELGHGRLTQVNMGMLSKGYGAPEQAMDAASVDERADVHALGVTLWAILKGEPPPDTWIFGQTLEANPDLLKGIPPVLIPTIVTATKHYRDDRFGSVEEMRAALQAVLDAGSLSRRTQMYAGGASVIEPTAQPRLPTPVGHRSSVIDPTLPDQQPPAFDPTTDSAAASLPSDVSAVSAHEVEPVHGEIDLADDDDVAREIQRVRRRRRMRVGIVASVIAVAVGVSTALLTRETPVEQVAPSIEPAVQPTPRRNEMVSEAQRPRLGQETTPPKAEAIPVVQHEPVVEPPRPEELPIKEVPKPVEPTKPPHNGKPPKPKPVPKPEATAIVKAPEPKPVTETPIETSRVSVAFPDGEPVKVWLIGPGGRHGVPGSVPPGTYKVMGAFPSGERTAIAALTVSGGRNVRITCNSAFAKCQAN